jgi:mannosyltransferase
MSAAADTPRPAGLRDRLAALPARVRAQPASLAWLAAGVAVLTVVSIVLRTRALDAAFWIDEGLSVGISSHALLDIPGVLEQDGSPPLYYALLHVWMQAFGNTETATHALSVVFAVLSVPAAFWAARSLFGPRAGWIAAALAAINPFLTFYAQETRMYALVALLGLLLAAAFLRVYADRERRLLPVFALVLALLLYTHNWGLFLAGGSVVALAWLWRAAAAGEERRTLVRDALIGYGAAGLAFVPWLPTLLFQAGHTGAPWAERPGVDALLSALGLLLGGPTTAIALMLVAGSGLNNLVREASPRARRTAALAILTASAIALAWLASQVSPAFANRYFAAFVGPMLLLAAVGLSHAGRLGLVCFVLVSLYWFDARTEQLETKSNARSVAASIQTLVTAGDLVVSTHPEQLPLLAYYLPDGVRYGTSMGPVDDPRVMDWRDALDRLRAAKPRPTARAAVDSLKRGQELVLVVPIIRTAQWGAPWTSLVRRRSVQWERKLDADRRVRREAVVPVFGYDRLPKGVRAIVYRRIR